MKLHLYSRPHCHLCDRLESLLQPHLDALARRDGAGTVHLVKFNIDDNAQWRDQYGQRIPVLAVNEQILLEGRPDPAAVERAMRSL